MPEKIKWLWDGKTWEVPTAVYPSLEKGMLKPFDWTLLKCADSPSGPPGEHLPLHKLASRASEKLVEQMMVLDESPYYWYSPELKRAEERAEKLKRNGLLFEKEPPAEAKGTAYKGWECPKCPRSFRRSRDLKNHLTDRRTHDMGLGSAAEYVQRVREQRREDYKRAVARSGLVERHLVPDLNAGALAGGEDHKDWIKGFAQRSKSTIFADWIHRGGKKDVFENGPPDIVRVKPFLDREGHFEADGLELERVYVHSVYWLIEKPFNVEFIAPPANRKRKQIEKALERAEDRTLILVAEDSPGFVEGVVEKKANGRVEHVAPDTDPATDLDLYREWKPGLVRLKIPGPAPAIPPTPEETWEEIRRLLRMGYDDPASIKEIEGNYYLYMNKNGKYKSAGRVTPKFWSGELEERTINTRYYRWRGEAKRGGKNDEFTRVEWTKEETDQKKRHDLLTP